MIEQNEPLLEIVNLGFYLAQSCILDGFNLVVNRGEILTLFGPSGCGKTTLLRLLSGILEPREGSIRLRGAVSYLFQEHRLFESLNVYENIALIKPDKKWILESLEAVGLNAKDALKYPRELSGGMCARVAFVRALANKSDLLLLDEPFAALDSKMREILIRKLTLLTKEQNMSIILVTHDAYEACVLSHKVLFLSKMGMKIEKTLKITNEVRSEEIVQDLLRREFEGRIYFD